MSFQRYPEYRESGIEWVGHVPAHWVCVRNKVVFKEVDERSETEEGELLTVSHITGVTPRSEKDVNMFLAETLEGYKRCKRGDLVINTMWAWMGALGCSRCDGLVSPAYNVYRLRAVGQVHPGYYDYLCRVPSHRTAMKANSSGVWESRLRLYPDAFLSMRLPIPPMEEQRAIAAFLDRETAKIDALVAEQERLIELLKEKRQAVISHAVTKGLNPDAPMKDSGIEWLGQVPAHWVVKRFQRCVFVIEGQVDPESSVYAALPLIAPNHVEAGTGRLLGLESATEQGAESGKYLCRAGDVVYSKIRPVLRKACIAPQQCLCSADMYPLRAHSGLTNPYLLWVILSEQFTSFAVLESQRVAMPKINRESLKEVLLALPPRAEQQSIAAYLERETAKIDALAGEARRAVDSLQERRTSLISAAVTGQIDVRPASLRTAA